MSQVEYCKPYDYSKLPHISKCFVPSREIPEKSWYVTESYVSSSNGAPVKTVAQVNGPLPSSGTVTPLPTEYWQTQSLKFELELQSQNVSKSCQNCKDREFFKNQCLKYEKEIAELKIENVEWQQNRDHIDYCNGLLESNIQDKNHIIIGLKEKIKLLQKGKFVDTTMIAPGMFEIDKIVKWNNVQTSNVSSSTSAGLVSPNSVSRPKTKSVKKTRIWQRKKGKLEVQEVEAHLRNLNKTHVASDLDSNLESCNPNLNVTVGPKVMIFMWFGRSRLMIIDELHVWF